ncbi:hypothetical protein I4U23_015881 [Adineta vaga]|nr:hypothetical protein I4U23_015881 [Adineta vaga]
MTLSSSLECFYNQTCLNILISAYSRNINISILDKAFSSRFTSQTKVEQLVGELFIEEVTHEVTFKSYYDRCKPSYCTYTVARRFDVLFVITSIIGLVGGLNVALRLLSPYVIDFILRFKQKSIIQIKQTETLTIKIHLQNLINKIKLSIIEVNVFNSHSQDLNRTNQERSSTRFYIILIIISISILIFSTLLSVQTIINMNSLQKLYPNTLKCPCTDIKILYADLFQIIPHYHQLCTSDFIQSWWYKTLNIVSNIGLDTLFDFRIVASSYFQMLSIFCDLANLTFIHANRRFSSTVYINNQILPRNLFHSQANALINTFLNSIPVEFQYTLSMINTILQSNQYLTSTQTNALLYTLDFSLYGISSTNPLQIIPYSMAFRLEDNTTCTCARHSSCRSPYRYGGNWTALGLYGGCFVMDMILKSSLACWYNQTCSTGLRRYFLSANVNISNNVTILDSTLTSRFLPTTSFEVILQEILVEQWNTSSSYETFYQKCRPTYCKYTYQERSSVVYMVTTIIALFGGLNVILRLISPFVANTFSTFTNKFRKNPQVSTNIYQITADNRFWGFQIKPDLRGRGAAYFGLISSLCKLSKTTINNAVDKFLDEILVNDQMIPEKEFSSRMNLFINRFQTNTPYKFSCSLQLLRDITHGNTFISTYVLNWEYVVKDNRSNATVSTVAVSPNNLCSCGKQSNCIAPGGIYQMFTNRLLVPLLGFNVGCSVVETVFRSTLQILYNQTTIDQIQQYGTDNAIYFPATKYIRAMNSTYPSRFRLNSSIIDIIDQLFVEQWKINISYASFYQQCAPMYCSYTFDERHDAIYIFTRLLAIYGGLTAVLRLITPYIINIIFSVTNRCRNNRIVIDT